MGAHPPERLTEEETAQSLSRMRAQVYREERPAADFARFHERSRTRDPDAMYELVRMMTSIYAFSIFRARSISSEKVPQTGPVIFAPNHFSFMDHFFLGAFVRRKVRFMAKSQMFRPPLQFVYTHGGVFPVRRGARDDDAFVTANSILERDGCLAMYCEGGRSRDGRLADRPKPGIGRIALQSGAPVVPVAIHGSLQVRNWKRAQFPKVTVQYGDPIRFEQATDPTRHQQQSVAEQIFEEIKVLYSGLETLGRRGALQRVREQRRAEKALGKRQPA